MVAALLNLTGLGLGYLYLRRWVRWGIHLVVTIGLFVAAYLTGAAGRPWLWLAIWGAWLLWMAVDGGLQAARLRRAAPERPAGRRWLPVVLGVAAVALAAGGVGAYLSFGQRESDRGMAAYKAGDCRPALQSLHRVTTLYELTLSPNVATADVKIVECNLVLAAENAGKGAAYAEAIAGYETYLETYPNGDLGPRTREQTAQVYLDWAAALRQGQEYDAAIGKYQVIRQQYPDTPAGLQAAALTAETYAEWAAAFHYTGQYEEAIARYNIILAEYADTPTGQQAAAAVAETYAAWGGVLDGAAKYEQAIEKYRIVLSQYADTPTGQQLPARVARSYESWAMQLRLAHQYEEALAQYQVIQRDFPLAPVAVYTLTAETYWEWAGQLRQKNEYEIALENYATLLADYGRVYTATQIRPAEAVTYAEWIAYLRTQGFYDLALAKCGVLTTTYAGTPEATAVPVTVGTIYNEWGQDLTTAGGYTEAMEKFGLARQSTDDAAVIAAADEGYDKAVLGLAQDTGREGGALLMAVAFNACAGEPTASPALGLLQDEPGKAVMGGGTFDYSLVGPIGADKPGHLQYAICSSSGQETIESCPYTGGHTLVRQRQWWRFRVHSPRSGQVLYDQTFWGSYPSACPATYSFSGAVQYTLGSWPSSEPIAEWLRGIIK